MTESSKAGRPTSNAALGRGAKAGRVWVWGAFMVLFALHHDFWWWGDRTLVWDFLPIGLAYHAAFSVAAGLLWVAASLYAWPTHLEAWAEQAGRGEASEVAGGRAGAGEEGR